MIYIKRETITFKVDEVRVIQPLDSYQGPRFIELVYDIKYPNLLDQLY